MSNKPFRPSNPLLYPFFQEKGKMLRGTRKGLKSLIIALFLLIPSCQPAFSEEINFDKLILAIIQVESNGNPNAVSKAGCIGLMQINPRGALAEWNNNEYPKYDTADLFDPAINVRIGTYYLKRLYHYYKCLTVTDISASYNGGITRYNKVNRDLKKMPRETQAYVRKVLKIYKQGN